MSERAKQAGWQKVNETLSVHDVREEDVVKYVRQKATTVFLIFLLLPVPPHPPPLAIVE